MTFSTVGPYSLSISTYNFREDIVPLADIAVVTVIDTSYNPSQPSSLGLYDGHEYNVIVRAHDVVAVGLSSSNWDLPGWPESGGLSGTTDHTAILSQLLRIDTTPPEILDLFLIHYSDGIMDRLPVLYANNPSLTSLGLYGVLQAGQGFTFLSDANLLNMRVSYGLYDEESGLRSTTFTLTETSFAINYALYQRTL